MNTIIGIYRQNISIQLLRKDDPGSIASISNYEREPQLRTLLSLIYAFGQSCGASVKRELLEVWLFHLLVDRVQCHLLGWCQLDRLAGELLVEVAGVGVTGHLRLEGWCDLCIDNTLIIFIYQLEMYLLSSQ